MSGKSSLHEMISQCVDENIDLVESEGIERLIAFSNENEAEALRLEQVVMGLEERLKAKNEDINDMSRANSKLSDANYELKQKVDALNAQLTEFDQVSNEREVLRQTASLHEERAATAMVMLDNAIKNSGVKCSAIE